ncbi:MAG: tRNA adenosine(34) deaminase TadA [Oceanicoccus sp.]
MSTVADHRYMEAALELAQKAGALGEVPVGAVVVLNDEIIGQGFNQPISLSDPTAHAEVMAIRDAAKVLHNYRLPEATLYVTIEPCTMCAGAMVHARIKRVVYGATELKSGVAESNGRLFDSAYLNHHVDVEGGVMAACCSNLISDFFAARRQQKKRKSD